MHEACAYSARHVAVLPIKEEHEPKWKLALKSVALLGSGVAAVRNILCLAIVVAVLLA